MKKMLRLRRTITVVLTLIMGVWAAAAHSESAKWLRADSPHFILYSNTGEKITRAYLTRLEQYRYLLTRFHGQTAEDDAETPRLNIYFLGSHSDLRQTWPNAKEGVQGYFKNCVQGQAAFAIYQDDFNAPQTTKVQDQRENLSQIVLFHEYAHNFMFQVSAARYPKWFVEGFAEFYSTTKFQNDQAVVGMESFIRARRLNVYDMFSYEKMLRDDKSMHSNPDANDTFYAHAWLLSHYILSSPERAKAFEGYLDAYAKGTDPVTAFETAFGIKVKDLPHLLDVYQDKNLMATVMRIKDMPTAQITVTPLPVSANKLLLWDAADRICPSREDSPALLAKIRTEAAKYPGDDYAQTALARAEIIIGDEAQALDYLLKYTGDHPEDAEGRYMLGQTWFLMTAHGHIRGGETKDSQMAKARSTLGKAYQLDPLNAADLFYYSLALGNGAEPPSDNMINAAIAAHNLAPSVDEYAVRAAELLIRKDRPEEAAEMLYPLANNPHDERLSQWASAIITAIGNKATRDDVLKLLKAPIAPSKQ